jgi:hypothetical protein
MTGCQEMVQGIGAGRTHGKDRGDPERDACGFIGEMRMMLKEIISGGQTGADVAGSMGSKDPEIYDKTFQVLEKAILRSE